MTIGILHVQLKLNYNTMISSLNNSIMKQVFKPTTEILIMQ